LTASTRAFEAGPDGLEFLAFGPHHPGDGAAGIRKSLSPPTPDQVNTMSRTVAGPRAPAK